ncbi:MAG: beta-glycosidase [Alphaproteobacteria bacterium]|nr:beta-glycosidase [Alphaproteobacteria bacterium]MDE2041654.1 glycoside hydrolase family 30 protein [Alphaproteobacteria bacterium]MDE2341508.1 glycoside hydrolase family 30 protein [Alphaproteobacteria bacterium]
MIQHNRGITRRQILGGIGAAGLAGVAHPQTGGARGRWVCTTASAPWREQGAVTPGPIDANLFGHDIMIDPTKARQTIDGFGGAFTEIGWGALQKTSTAGRAQVMADLFGAEGCAFTICRTPIGGNDLSRRWYSYDEVDGDFDMAHFSVANDDETLIPYIKAAQTVQPRLKLWASPWSPPTWMKRNHHYAMAPAWPGQPSNGIKPDQVGIEGKDYFIQEERYFAAYARYFRRYVEEYSKVGIPVSMVAPQNEFNSAQPYPSCCWTPQGLAKFIAHLGPEMDKVGTDIFFGTLERPNAALLDAVLADRDATRYIKGVGVQWAGKGALHDIHKAHPDLPIWSSEQECGFGTNDWHYARYIWREMQTYFENGARAWMYWDMVMPSNTHSTWGWPQNSMITVKDDGSLVRNHEYWLLRHFSQFVKPGAHYLPATSFSGYDNISAFANPDGSIILVAHNDMAQPQPLRIILGDTQINLTLPTDSFNTIII